MRPIQRGRPASFCPTPRELEGLTAQAIAQAAEEGDPLAREVYACSGQQLGGALALLVDLLNPEAVVIGSIYALSLAPLPAAGKGSGQRTKVCFDEQLQG